MLPAIELGTCEDVLKEYIKQLKSISVHQFMKIWQMKNFKMSLQNLRKGQLLLVPDFSQNLLLIIQEEVSSAHWDHEQATIHPTIAFYIGACGKLIKEEIIHITADRKHDHNAIREFQRKTIEYLRGKGVKIYEIIEWTDHCSNQYKSRKAFFTLTMMEIPTTHNFFGVKHGKGPSDRAGAHFKNFVSGVVKSRKARLVTVNDLAMYSVEKYENQVKCSGDHEHNENSKMTHQAHNLIKVIHTDGEIPRNNKFQNTVTYKGTCNIHTIGNTGIEGIMEKRDMSCCCPKCLYDEDECLFPEYADVWTLISVVGQKKLRNIKNISSINMWHNAKMALIRGIRNAEPNFMPNGSSSCKKRKSTARRKLIMANDSKETVAGVNVKSDVSDEQSEIDALESKKDIQSVSNVELEKANISQEAPFDWVLVATELRSCRTYAEVVGVVRRYILPQIDLSRKYCQTVRDVIVE